MAIAELEAGVAGQVDTEALAAVAAAPMARQAGSDVYPGIHLKTAALLDAIMRVRPFGGLDERIALIAIVVFLNLNGHDLEAEPDELALLVRMTGQGRLPLLDVAAGIESATVRLRLDDLA